MANPRKALRSAIATRKAAEAHVRRVLRTHFPVGAFVAYDGNNGTLLGRVLDHAPTSERIKVENCKTGRAYWIYAWRLK